MWQKTLVFGNHVGLKCIIVLPSIFFNKHDLQKCSSKQNKVIIKRTSHQKLVSFGHQAPPKVKSRINLSMNF